jgi:hypothetical protein
MRLLNRKWRAFIGDVPKKTVLVDEPSSMDMAKIVQQALEKVQQDQERQRRDKELDIQVSKLLSEVTPQVPPQPVFPDPMDDIERFLELWNPDDIIFIGTPYCSKGSLYKANEDYISSTPIVEGTTLTCSSVFKDIDGPRKDSNVIQKRYIVLEHDHQSIEFQWGLLQYINTHIVPLVMCVHSGGKSLHGWFNYDEAHKYLDLFIKLGYDESLWRLQQPCRLPGMFREDKQKYQRILYWNPQLKNTHLNK